MKKLEISEIEELTIVVDMVNGFAKEGVMADPYIMHIVPAIRSYMVEALESPNKAVVVIKENHDENAKEFDIHPPHCKKGTKEAELVDELKDLEEYCYTFLKNSTSAIWAPGFLDFIKALLKNPKFRKIRVVGCCTDICVMDLSIPLKKLLDQLNIDVEVIVPTEAVETFQIKPHTYDEDGKLVEEGIHDRNEWNTMAFKFMKQAGIQVEEKGYQKVKA